MKPDSAPLITFVGAGRMASAMVHGMLAGETFQAAQIACTSAADGTGEALAEATGIRCTHDLEALLAAADTVVLAIKPQQLGELPATTAGLTEGRLILSILAGTPLAVLRQRFPEARNIVRVMPNTPGQIGAGASAYASLEPLSDADRHLVEAMLAALGNVYPVREDELDAVTGVSGSGPAYVFMFIAALRDAGINQGLAPDLAARLALDTVLGAAKLVAHTGDKPETLRDRVTSKGGTTLAGLQVMDDRDFPGLMDAVVAAATARSKALSDEATHG